MKHLLTFLMLACSYILCGAQATSLTVDNKVAGTLSQRILYDDIQTVKNLTITGELNADDFTFINELNTSHQLNGTLDLSNATIVAGGRRYISVDTYKSTESNTFNAGIFLTSNRINKLIVPRDITSWNDGSYSQRNGSSWITAYSNLNTDSLIIDCPNLKRIGNGIGNPSYIYIGEGVIGFSLASKYLNRLPGASDDHYIKASDSMCIYLPRSLEAVYGNSRMGSPRFRIYSKILRPDTLYTGTSKNWYDEVLVNGVVYAPNDTKKYYLSSIFKKLEIVSAISVKSITLSTKKASVKVGDNLHLTATVLPSNADDISITWSSSNPSTASVSKDGTITALAPGSTDIIAHSNFNPEIKAICSVEVIQPATGISFDKNEVEIFEDESLQLHVNVLPENSSNKNVTWTSSDISIAMVSQDGTVYAVKPGNATIMATTEDGGFVALCKVKVKAKTITATGLSLSTNSGTMLIGEKLQLSASISPDNASNKSIAWTSTNANIASVDASGLVSALSDGETKIIATTTDGSNISAVCDIKVEKQLILASQIQINPTSMKLNTGESKVLTAIITPEETSSKEIQWSSTAPSVATISQDGEVYAVAEGEAIIVASTKDGSNLSASCSVIVSTTSGIESIAEFIDSTVKVFSINGYLLHEGKYSDAKLVPGIYIIVYNGKSYKMKVE